MSATEDDLQWLRNVNTRPGPDAGRSIDPSKPGPDEVQSDADRIAELEREIYTLRANLVECADTLSAQQFNQAQQKRIEACRIELAALIQSDAEPQPDDNFERHLQARISKLEHDAENSSDDYMRVLQSWKHAEFTAEQSKRGAAAWRPLVAGLEKRIAELEALLTQSDAGPVAKPVTWMIFWEGKWEPTSEDEYERRSNDLHWKDRVIALYPSGLTAPPHPDASAGLIEAAEWHEAQKRKTMNPNRIMVHKLSAEHFRARAADRSGK